MKERTEENWSRRAFLGTGAALLPFAVGMYFSRHLGIHSVNAGQASRKQRYLFSPSMVRSGANTFCAVFDLESSAVVQIEVPLTQAHSAAFHPGNPDRVFVFDAMGPLACEVSISEKRLIRSFTGKDGNLFGGHGAFLTDGTLFSVEVDKSGEGRLVGRDYNTLKCVADFPTGGHYPHQVEVSPDGRTIIVANEGNDKLRKLSSMSHVDAASGRILTQVFSSLANEKFRHLAISENGDYALAAKIIEINKHFDQKIADQLTRERRFREVYEYRTKMTDYLPTPMKFYEGNGNRILDRTPPPEIFQRMGNTNSISIDRKRNVVAASHSAGNSVTFWDATTKQLLGEYHLGARVPRGIVHHPEEDCFFLHTMDQGLLKFTGPNRSLSQVEGVRFLGYAHLVVG